MEIQLFLEKIIKVEKMKIPEALNGVERSG